MPLYEYKCNHCGYKFELVRNKMNPDKEAVCPKCGADSPRVPSTFNFQFSPYLKELGGKNMVDY